MNNRVKANIAAFITVFLWASAFPLTKIIGDQFSANSLSFMRCLIAALLMIVIGVFSKSPELHMRKPAAKKDWLYFFAAGATGFAFYYICFNKGLETLSSAESSVICATAPVITSILVYFFFKERINIIGWISILGAFAGVGIMLMWNGVFSIKVGAFWILALSVFFSFYNIISRKLTDKGYTSLEIVAYGAICASIIMIFFLPQSVSELAKADAPAVLSVIYLGLLPTGVSYILWSKAIELSERTSEVTNYIFVTPLLSTVMGFMMLREVPDMATIIGGIIIIIGVVTFSMKGTPREL